MPRSVRSWGLLPLTLAIFCAGCSGGADDRLPVSGNVTLKGRPLAEGSISFVPLDKPMQDKTYTQSGAEIKDGKYTIPKAHGLAPGRYKVLISEGIKQEATGGEAPGPSGGGKRGSAIDRVPPEYNEKSKQFVEVKKGEANEFNFTIP